MLLEIQIDQSAIPASQKLASYDKKIPTDMSPEFLSIACQFVGELRSLHYHTFARSGNGETGVRLSVLALLQFFTSNERQKSNCQVLPATLRPRSRTPALH